MKTFTHLTSSWLGRALLVIIVIVASSAGCTRYDAETPDTDINRTAFHHYIGFAPPDSVTDLYFYADELGADVNYQFGFSADQATIDTIIEDLALTTEELPYSGINFARDFDWWISDEIDELPLYSRTNEKGDYHFRFWYDAETGRAYYLEYSL